MMTDKPLGSPSGYSHFFINFILLLAGLFLVPGCTGNREPYRETRFVMGTLVDVVVYAEKETAVPLVHRAYDRMNEIEREAHVKGKGSPLARLRDGEGVLLDGDVARVMKTAMTVSVATSGAFDPTLGQLVQLWGFGNENPRLPGAEEIRSALEWTGYGRIPETGCCPEGPKVWLDLGGVAKGYAVDEAVRILRVGGIESGIVNAGGDLRSFGSKPGKRSWKIGVQHPDNPQEMAGVLEVEEVSVATSGDYQRYFERDGVRYHHILDSKTGYPARSGIRSATVLAPDCALADALATAAFVMGPERGLAMLEGRKGVEGILITDDGAYHVTSGIGKTYPFDKR
jgi:thiamine biosynthesis lipoprotein